MIISAKIDCVNEEMGFTEKRFLATGKFIEEAGVDLIEVTGVNPLQKGDYYYSRSIFCAFFSSTYVADSDASFNKKLHLLFLSLFLLFPNIISDILFLLIFLSLSLFIISTKLTCVELSLLFIEL